MRRARETFDAARRERPVVDMATSAPQRRETPRTRRNAWLADARKTLQNMPEGRDRDRLQRRIALETSERKRSIVDDMATETLIGVASGVEALVGVASLATGGRAGQALEQAGLHPRRATDALRATQSKATKAALEAFDSADGIQEAVGVVMSNPRLITGTLIQTVPLMVSGSLVGRGLMWAAPKLSKLMRPAFNAIHRLRGAAPTGQAARAVGRAAARGRAMTRSGAPALSPRWAAAAGEGAVAGGLTAEGVRQDPGSGGRLTVGQSALAAGAGVATAGVAGVVSRAARRMGATDIEQWLVQAAENPEARKSAATAIVVGAVSEGVEEGLQGLGEDVAHNVATGKAALDGAEQTAVLGIASGLLLGGGMNAGVAVTAHANAEEWRSDFREAAEKVVESAAAHEPGPEFFSRVQTDRTEALSDAGVPADEQVQWEQFFALADEGYAQMEKWQVNPVAELAAVSEGSEGAGAEGAAGQHPPTASPSSAAATAPSDDVVVGPGEEHGAGQAVELTPEDTQESSAPLGEEAPSPAPQRSLEEMIAESNRPGSAADRGLDAVLGGVAEDVSRIRESIADLPESIPPNVQAFRPDKVKIDARRFQFKAGGDEAGVTERLQGIRKWNPAAAGLLMVWESNDGDAYVVDGHQRSGLARRIMEEQGDDSIRLNAQVVREADGISDTDARLMAAMKNIAEGSATPIDAAKVLRDAGADALDLPPQSALVRDAKGLADLGEQAFWMATQEITPPANAALVGKMVPRKDDGAADDALQVGVLKVLGKTDPRNAVEAASIIRDALAAQGDRETTADLFGEVQTATPLIGERAKVLSWAMSHLRTNRTLFRKLAERRETIEAEGNVLAGERNVQRERTDAELLTVIEKEAALRGPISDALNAAAQQLRDGTGVSKAGQGFLAAVVAGGSRLGSAGDAAQAPGAARDQATAGEGESGGEGGAGDAGALFDEPPTGGAPAQPEPADAAARQDVTAEPAAGADVAARDVQAAIRAAYAAAPASRAGGGYVELADLRDQLGEEYARADIDKAIIELFRSKEAHLTLHEDQKRLTQADRDSAVRLGVDDMHLISLDGGAQEGDDVHPGRAGRDAQAPPPPPPPPNRAAAEVVGKSLRSRQMDLQVGDTVRVRRAGEQKVTRIVRRDAKRGYIYFETEPPAGRSKPAVERVAAQPAGVTFGSLDKTGARPSYPILRGGETVGEIRRTKGGTEDPGWRWTVSMPDRPLQSFQNVRAAKAAATKPAPAGAPQSSSPASRQPAATPPPGRMEMLRAAKERAEKMKQQRRRRERVAFAEGVAEVGEDESPPIDVTVDDEEVGTLHFDDQLDYWRPDDALTSRWPDLEGEQWSTQSEAESVIRDLAAADEGLGSYAAPTRAALNAAPEAARQDLVSRLEAGAASEDAVRAAATVASRGTTRKGRSEPLPEQPAPTPAETPAGQTVRGIELPELVSLAEQLGAHLRVRPHKRFEGWFRPGKGAEGAPQIGLDPEVFENDPVSAARTLAHEIGHLIDWLPDRVLKRGNILGRLQTLRRFMRQSIQMPVARGGNLIGAQKVTQQEVNDELAAWSKSWREWPDDAPEPYNKYRNRSEELYADALSGLLNDPGRFRSVAPTFFDAFFTYLERKPAAGKAYFELMDLLGGSREDLLDARFQKTVAAFQAFRQTAAETAETLAAVRKLSERNATQKLFDQHVDVHGPTIRKAAEVAKRAGHGSAEANEARDVALTTAERNYAAGKMYGFMLRHYEPMSQKLADAEIPWDTFGAYLQYRRTAEGNPEVQTDEGPVKPPAKAAPQGLDPKAARELMAKVEKDLGPEKMKALNGALADFRAAIESTIDLGEESGLFGPDLVQFMRENEAYATYHVVDYAGERVNASIKKRVGTFRGIGNPAQSTMLKMLAIREAAHANAARRTIIDFHLKNADKDAEFPDIVSAESREHRAGQRHIPKPPGKLSGYQTVTYLDDGELKGAYVQDRGLQQSIENDRQVELNAVLEPIRKVNQNFLTPLMILYNPSFQVKNVGWRDPKRTYQNAPNATARKIVSAYIGSTELARARSWDHKLGSAKVAENVREDLIQAFESGLVNFADYRQYYAGQTTQDTLVQDLLSKYNLQMDPRTADALAAGQARGLNRFRRWAGWWFTGLQNYGEARGKMAAVEYMKRETGKAIKDFDPWERNLIRTAMASPDFFAGGSRTQESRVLFLYSQPMIEGMRTDLRLAFGAKGTQAPPGTRAAWWARFAKKTVLPKLAMWAMYAGATEGIRALQQAVGNGDDDEETREGWLWDIRRMFHDIDDYFLSNYLVVPLFRDENDEVVFLTVPQDDFSRVLGSALWKVLKAVTPGESAGLRDIWPALFNVMDYAADDLPRFGPVFTAGGAWMEYLRGGNPSDTLFRRPILTPNEHAAQDWRGAWTMVKYTGREFGLGNIMQPQLRDRPDEPATALKNMRNIPVAGRLFSAFVRHAKAPYNPGDAATAASRKAARHALDERYHVNRVVETIKAETPGEGKGRARTAGAVGASRTIAGELYPDDARLRRERQPYIERSIRMRVLLGYKDRVGDAVQNSKTTPEKVAVILHAKRNYFGRSEFQEWQRAALASGIMSENLLKAVLVEEAK